MVENISPQVGRYLELTVIAKGKSKDVKAALGFLCFVLQI